MSAPNSVSETPNQPVRSSRGIRLSTLVSVSSVFVLRLLSQIDPAIEEASISLGASNAQTFRRITLVLIRPAFFSGLVYAFARSMTTISAIVFLTTPQTKIMTAQILNEVENGRFGNAFAYCVILILIVLSSIGILAVTVGATSGTERSLQGGS